MAKSIDPVKPGTKKRIVSRPPGQSWNWKSLGLIGGLTILVSAPVVAAAFSPLQTGRAGIWIFGTLAGVLALSLLVVQVTLPTGWLRKLLTGRDMWVHRLLGQGVLVLVLGHIVGLYIYSPDDIGDALVLAAPTYSRLGVIAAWCLILSVGLALARRKLPLDYSDWQILHAFLAVAVVGTTVAHVLMLEGTIDGLVEMLVCGAAVLTVTFSIIFRLVIKPLRRRRLTQQITPTPDE